LSTFWGTFQLKYIKNNVILTEFGFEPKISLIYSPFLVFDSNKKTQHKLSFFDFLARFTRYISVYYTKNVLAPAMGFERESVLKHDFPSQYLILAKLFLKTSN